MIYDDNGQPLNRLYSKKRLNDRAIDELIGISRGIIADKNINEEEAKFLRSWMEANVSYCEDQVVNQLYRRIQAFGFKEYGNGFKIDGRRLKLSFIGRVAVRWHRPIEGEIKTLRVKRLAGKWYACFACETEPKPIEPTGREVGIDVGISSLIATSDGETVGNPQWYRAEQKKLRVAQRRVARRKKGGANRRKAVAILQRQHERIANRRKDCLNKLALQLVTDYDRIAVENLNVRGMSRNHHLSKSILDSGWSYFRQRLDDKAVEAGRLVVGVNPAYTSKTCSGCGMIFEGLTLSDRWVNCACGVSLDRDINAAHNILRAGQARWGLT